MSVWAVPAKPGIRTVIQPDGSELRYYLRGDEFGHFYETEDSVLLARRPDGAFSYALLENNCLRSSGLLAHGAALRTADEQSFVHQRADERRQLLQRQHQVRVEHNLLRTSRAPHGEALTGSLKGLVLLVQFSDQPFTVPNANGTFQEYFNGDNYTGGYNKGSVRQYFTDQSDSLFQPQFDVFGPYTLNREMAYYGGNDEDGNDEHPQEMVSEVCRLASSDVNFSDYDADGDGSVDFLYVIYAGYAESSGADENTVWPHQGSMYLKVGGVLVNSYACSSELLGISGSTISGIGTVCHEFSHILGLPDFYDVQYGGHSGMGIWSLMDQGNYLGNGGCPCNYTAYERGFMGWTDIEAVSQDTSLVLTPLCQGGKAYRLENDANADEYLLLENRQQTGWDANLMGHGLMVLHVDYNASLWNLNRVNISDPQHMYVVPANNNYASPTSLTVCAGNLYPGTTGNDELTDNSLPAARTNDGSYFHKPITQIKEDSGLISLRLLDSRAQVPEATQARDLTSYSFTATWNPVDEADGYLVSLYHIVGYDGPANSRTVATVRDYGLLQEEAQTAGTAYLFTNLEAGELYAYRVRSTVEESVSSYSNAVFQTVLADQTGLAAPDACRLTMLDSYSMQIDWNPVEGAEYVVEIRGEEQSADPQPAEPDFSTLVYQDFSPMKASYGDISRVVDLYTNQPGWTGYGLTACDEYVQIGSETEDGRLYLPYLDVTSGALTVNFMVRRSASSDRNTDLYICLATDADPLYFVEGYGVSLDTDDWVSYYAVFRQLDTNPRLAFFTDGDKPRVDFGGVLVMWGDASEAMEADGRTRLKRLEELPEAQVPSVGGDDSPALDEDAVACPIGLNHFRTSETTLKVNGLKTATYQVRVRAVKDGVYSVYGPASQVNAGELPFLVDGVTYSLLGDSTVAVCRPVTGDYAGDVVIPDSIYIQGNWFRVTALNDSVFRGCTDLRSVSVPASVVHVGARLFKGCRNLCYVRWNSPADVPAESFVGVGCNALLYVSGQTTVNDGTVTVVADGHAEGKVVFLSDAPFYAPEAFMADTAMYVHSFEQATYVGQTAGWETLVLPFDVQTYAYGDKQIRPFDASGEGDFWMARFEDDGFGQAASMEAYVPYILSFPNSEDYALENRLSGYVYFEALDAQIGATAVRPVEGRQYAFVPTFETTYPTADVWTLNIYDAGLEEILPGSTFISDRQAVYPFHAYVRPLGSAAAASEAIRGTAVPAVENRLPIRLKGQGPETLPADEFQVYYENGRPMAYTPEARQVSVVALDGRTVARLDLQAGCNELTGISRGFYLMEGRKLLVP